MANYNYVIYDFEVRKKEWEVTIKELGKEEWTLIDTNRNELIEFINSRIHNTIFVGFNNKNYDQYIMKGIYAGLDPFMVSDAIINKKIPGWKISGMPNSWVLPILQYDVKNEDVSMTNFALSLKEFEANMGESIEEMNVPWYIDRLLTPEEKVEMVGYCMHDVRQTEKMFLLQSQQEFLQAKLDVMKEFNLPITSISQTNANIVDKIFGGMGQELDGEDQYFKHPVIDIKQNADALEFYSGSLESGMKKEVALRDLNVTFALGGIHGAKEKYIAKNKTFYMIDVMSYYPNLMIHLGYFSRNAGSGVELLSNLYNQRIILKAQGNNKQIAFKLIINILSGIAESPYHKVRDVHQARGMRITGQLLLLDLMEKIEPYVNIVQVNTDGIMFELEDENNKQFVDEAVKHWEDKTKLKMEYDKATDVFQKDVNNYILYNKETDEVEVKGGHVKFWKKMNPYKNTLRILDEALVKYFVYDIPIEETICNPKDIRDYQIVTKTSGKYDGTKIFHNGEWQDVQKTNRIFATMSMFAGGIMKYRTVDDKYQEAKFANTPERCKVYNGYIMDKNVKKFLEDEVLIDYQWYIDQAKRRIELWTGEKNVN